MKSNNSDAIRKVFDALTTIHVGVKGAKRLAATMVVNQVPPAYILKPITEALNKVQDNKADEILTKSTSPIVAKIQALPTLKNKPVKPVKAKDLTMLTAYLGQIEDCIETRKDVLFKDLTLDELAEISTAIDFGTRNPIQVDGTASGGPSGGGALTDRVDQALRGLLGRPLNRASAPVIRSALNAACTATKKEGHMDVVLKPHASITVGVRGGGGQPLPEANLASMAADLAEWAPALLEEIKPIKPGADPEIIEAWREQVKDGLEGLLEEMNRAEGVRKTRAKLFFEHLGLHLLRPIHWKAPHQDKAIALPNLREALGIEKWGDQQKYVNTLIDEEEVAKFFKLQHGVEALATAFNRFAQAAEKFLSSQLRSANRALLAVAEATRTLEKTLDSVQVGQAQRELLHFSNPDNDLSLQGFLNWVENYAEHDAPAALEASGKKAKQSTHDTLDKLHALAQRDWTQELLPSDAIPSHPRVTRAQDALEKALQSAQTDVGKIN